MTMNIRVNGENIVIAENAKLLQLVKLLALEGKRYAIEVNEDIVPRSEHSRFTLSNNDNVEVVQAIGGG